MPLILPLTLTCSGLCFLLCGSYELYKLLTHHGVAVANTPLIPLTGLIMAGFGLRGLYKIRWQRQTRARLLREGVPLVARINRVDQNTSIRINGRSPYVIYCSATDPKTNARLDFASHNIWPNPLYALADKQEITVYLDPKDATRYVVDPASCGVEEEAEGSARPRVRFIILLHVATVALYFLIELNRA